MATSLTRADGSIEADDIGNKPVPWHCLQGNGEKKVLTLGFAITFDPDPQLKDSRLKQTQSKLPMPSLLA